MTILNEKEFFSEIYFQPYNIAAVIRYQWSCLNYLIFIWNIQEMLYTAMKKIHIVFFYCRFDSNKTEDMKKIIYEHLQSTCKSICAMSAFSKIRASSNKSRVMSSEFCSSVKLLLFYLEILLSWISMFVIPVISHQGLMKSERHFIVGFSKKHIIATLPEI